MLSYNKIFYLKSNQIELLLGTMQHSINNKDMLDAIAHSGAIVEFLTFYSPDLNPITQKWSQSKAIQKTLNCNDIDNLFAKYFKYAIL